jgi:hypothetical protein
VVLVLVPVLIGALVGLLLAVLPAVSYRAVVLVDGGPGATQADALGTSPDVSNRFVQTELVYIDIADDQIRTAITNKVGIANPASVVTRQVGTTNVIEIAATGPTAQQAADAANVAAAIYVDGWKKRTAADLEGSIDVIKARVAAIDTRLDALPATGGTPSQAAERDSLTNERSRLSEQQATAAFQRDTVLAAQRVVAPATAAGAVKTSSIVRAVIFGGMFGLVAGVGLLLFVRRRSSGADRRSWLD